MNITTFSLWYVAAIIYNHFNEKFQPAGNKSLYAYKRQRGKIIFFQLLWPLRYLSFYISRFRTKGLVVKTNLAVLTMALLFILSALVHYSFTLFFKEFTAYMSTAIILNICALYLAFLLRDKTV